MRILIVCPLAKEALEQFDEYNLKTTIFNPSRDNLIDLLPHFEAIIINRDTILDIDNLKLATNLKVIATISKETANIDLDYATTLGITVINVSRGIKEAIAEYTIWQMLTMARTMVENSFELKSKTLGIIGLGNIGAQVAKKAKALDMRIICYDPYLSHNRAVAYEIEPVSLIDLLIMSDIITIHAPFSEETNALLGYDLLALVKPNAMLINNSHPLITPAPDLLKALVNKNLSAIALDLQTNSDAHLALSERKNALISVQKAWVTTESMIGIGKELAHELTMLDNYATSINAINMPIVPDYQQNLYAPSLKNASFVGNFMGQYISEDVSEILLYDHENLPDSAPIVQTFLQAFLTSHGISGVNYVNALTIAYRHNITMRSLKSSSKEKGLTIKINTNSESYQLCAHLDMENKFKITSIDNCLFTALPSNHVLLIWHKSKPGVVGLIGSALGACGINISSMTLNEPEDENAKAIIFINIDRALDSDFLNGICKYENVFEAKYINTNLQ